MTGLTSHATRWVLYALVATSIDASAQVGGIVGGVVPGPPGQTRQPANAPPRRDQPAPTGTAQIRGRVVDRATGTPLRRAQVTLMGGGLREPRGARTDDQGAYVIDSVPAGSYFVRATRAGYVQGGYGETGLYEPSRQVRVDDGRTVTGIDISLMRGGVITGRVVDELGEPMMDVQVFPMRFIWMNGTRRLRPTDRPGMTNDIGEFRLYGLAPGEVVLSATVRAFNTGPVSADDRSGYAPSYYPGTPDAAQAQTIRLEAGQQVSDLTLMLFPVRTARVSGTVFDAQGAPLRSGSVSAMQRDTGLGNGGASGMIRPDGTFTIASLAPGNYRLSAMVEPFTPGRTTGGPPATAVADVVVSSDDLTGVQLTVPRLVTVTGRVVVDPAAARTLRANAMMPTLVRLDDFMSPPSANRQPVRDDLTFTTGTYPGVVTLRMMLPPGWMVRRATVNGVDVSEGFEVTGDVDGLEVELSNRAPDVTAQVTEVNGQPAAGAMVMVFPQDPEQRMRGAFGRTATARVDEQGTARVRTLLPGRYFVAAIRGLPVGPGGQSPEFLESLIPRAERLEVAEGDARTITLRVN